jgi:two-component system, NarL family, sensor kinase
MSASDDRRPEEVPLAGVEEIAREIARLSAENESLLSRLSRTELRFRSISQGLLRMQEAERGRLSRELHDGVGQSLTALKMQIELLARTATREGTAMAAPLSNLVMVADAALQEVRQISHLLRPQMLDDLGLVPSLRWLARTWGQRTGIEVHVGYEGPEERLHPDLETVVYRLVQEALTNAAKHSGAPAVDVEVRREPAMVTVEVRDQGRGFALPLVGEREAEGRGFGLRGLRDRVQLFGGQLVVDSAPGRGTVVRAEVPVPRASEA